MMENKKIRLNEAQLRQIIKEAVQAAIQQQGQQIPQQQNLGNLGETQLTEMFKNAIMSNNIQLAQQIAQILENRVESRNVVEMDESLFGKNEQGVVCGTRIGLPYIPSCNAQQKAAIKQLLTTWYSNTIGLQYQGYDPEDYFGSFLLYCKYGLRDLGVKVR